MILVRYVKEPGTAISVAIKKAKDKWVNIQDIYLSIITSKGYFSCAASF
jgi:hypothetical protein